MIRSGRVRLLAIVLVSGFALLLAGTFVVGWYISREATDLTDSEHPDLSYLATHGIDLPVFLEEHGAEDAKYPSTLDEHTIPATLLHTTAPKSEGWVVLVHGLGATRESTYPYAQYFLDRGWNVLAYDQRSSGENTAEENTFGVWERHDLADSLAFLEETGRLEGADATGVWGTSFGGITSALAIAEPEVAEQVDFLVLDSPVSNAREMIDAELAALGMPARDWLLWWADLATRARLGFSFEDANAPAQLRGDEGLPPTLVISGTDDTLTPPHMGADIAEAMGRAATVWHPEGSGHVTAFDDHPHEYVARLDGLLDEALL